MIRFRSLISLVLISFCISLVHSAGETSRRKLTADDAFYAQLKSLPSELRNQVKVKYLLSNELEFSSESLFRMMVDDPMVIQPTLASRSAHVYTLIPEILEKAIKLDRGNVLSELLKYPNLVDWLDQDQRPHYFIMTVADFLQLSKRILNSVTPKTDPTLKFASFILRNLEDSIKVDKDLNIDPFHKVICQFAAGNGLIDVLQATIALKPKEFPWPELIRTAIAGNQVSTLVFLIAHDEFSKLEPRAKVSAISIAYRLAAMLGNAEAIKAMASLARQYPYPEMVDALKESMFLAFTGYNLLAEMTLQNQFFGRQDMISLVQDGRIRCATETSAKIVMGLALKYQVVNFRENDIATQEVRDRIWASWMSRGIGQSNDWFRPIIFAKKLEAEHYKDNRRALKEHIHTALYYRLHSQFKMLIEYAVTQYGNSEPYKFLGLSLKLGDEEPALWILNFFPVPSHTFVKELLRTAEYDTPTVTLWLLEKVLQSKMKPANMRSVIIQTLSNSLTHDTAGVTKTILFGPAKSILSPLFTFTWFQGRVFELDQYYRGKSLIPILYKAQEVLDPKKLTELISECALSDLWIVEILKKEKHLWSSLAQEARDELLIVVSRSEDAKGIADILDTDSLKRLSSDALEDLVDHLLLREKENSVVLNRLQWTVFPHLSNGQALSDRLLKRPLNTNTITGILRGLQPPRIEHL